MDTRAAKLALARKKLKDHQEKKSIVQKDEDSDLQYILHKNNEHQENIVVNEDAAIIPIDFQYDKESESNQITMETHYSTDINHYNQNLQTPGTDINVTELLIASKRNLELQIVELQSKLAQFEYNQGSLINVNQDYKQQINYLENQVKNLNDKYVMASEEVVTKDMIVKELNCLKSSLSDENNNLHEQLEFAKSMLSSKKSENASLQNHLGNLQTQLDVTNLQLQQLTNGMNTSLPQNNRSHDDVENAEVMLQKVSNLEQQLKALQKEKEDMNLHYEHYVGELNVQLRSVALKNEELTREIQIVSNRESSLIEQIGDMENRLKNYQTKDNTLNVQTMSSTDMNYLQQNYESIQIKFEELNNRYNQLQIKYAENENTIKELSQLRTSKLAHDNISISKLNADITSDKVAVQRATEQNKKLKTDLQELEEAFVKISKDKLELTEKLAAEKFLNRELTIKLAEIEEKAKNLHTKLIAKDEEMIRLQKSYRDIKTDFKKLAEASMNAVELQHNVEETITQQEQTSNVEEENKHLIEHNMDKGHDQLLLKPTFEEKISKSPKEDAMLKLQQRFLKIMEEVADLSDEKHRLEHIILQLQNETDTICEYVALYQQQRSLLKKKDEERSAQIKLFQSECELLKNQLEELSTILIKLTKDPELSTYFQTGSRYNDIDKVKTLLSKLKNSLLIDPKRNCSELKNFYPCSCCSGKLIDV